MGNSEEFESKPTRNTSFIKLDDLLVEQININKKNKFICYNTKTGEANIKKAIETATEIIEPLKGEDVEEEAIKLPDGIEEYTSTNDLLIEIEEHIEKYLDVSPFYLKLAACYVLLSWVYDRFNTLPYLRALGDTGCGKSRFEDVIGGLCYKSICASGCVTPAPIYRMLKRWRGTLILDEADMKHSDEYSEVVTILNCGFERGRPVIRATKDNPDRVQILPVFGPKILATRRRFSDSALEARCLTEIMTETCRTDIPAVLSSNFHDEQKDLRNKLLLFRFRNYSGINPESAKVDLGNIEPRLKQVSESFLALFASEPEVLKSYKAFIRAHQKELIEQRLNTPDGQVVDALFKVIGYPVKNVTLVTCVTGEKVLPFSSSDIATITGTSARSVGQVMKNLGLKTKVTKIDGKPKRCFIFDKQKLKILRKRYIPKDDD